MTKLELLKALGIELPKELFECEISFKVKLDEKNELQNQTIVEGTKSSIRAGLMTIIEILIKKGIFKDWNEVQDCIELHR